MKKQQPNFINDDYIEDIEQSITTYQNYFLGFINSDIECNYDMSQRYSLYLADKENRLSFDQQLRLQKIDKKFIRNYISGKYVSKYADLMKEIDLFFDWLIKENSIVRIQQ
jgi:hypothetical protein